MVKKAKVVAVESTTLKEIADVMARDHLVDSSRGRHEFLQAFISEIENKLSNGTKVKIPGFGILQVKDRPARMGRNPATGEAIKIKASRKVSFRVAKALKEAVL